MANERNRVMRMLTKDQVRVLRQENRLARDVVSAYSGARKELLAEFIERVMALGPNPSPAQIRWLANDVGLIRAIEGRLAMLEREVAQLVEQGLRGVSEVSFQAAMAEVVSSGMLVPTAISVTEMIRSLMWTLWATTTALSTSISAPSASPPLETRISTIARGTDL